MQRLVARQRSATSVAQKGRQLLHMSSDFRPPDSSDNQFVNFTGTATLTQNGPQCHMLSRCLVSRAESFEVRMLMKTRLNYCAAASELLKSMMALEKLS